MKAATQILESLAAVFAPMDTQVLAASQQWAQERITALGEFKKTEEYQSLRRNQHALYNRLFDIAGGKTWYIALSGGNEVQFVEKNCAAIAAKRNASITAKLVKAGVQEVVSESYTHTNDGFDGIFIVNTDAGQKTVTVNTIAAGGYNIVCRHLRVLVKVK